MKHPRIFEGRDLETRVDLGKVYREARLDVRNVTLRADDDEDDDEPEEILELELAFASEEPVERFFGLETLDVTPNAARLDRVAQGVCPLLSNHNAPDVVGRVLSVTIGSDRIARARVRFSRSAAARDVVRDVVDGIRQGISFGYRVHRMELTESGDDGDSFRVTDWELFEITIASMPADPTVGVHRSADEGTIETLVSRKEPAVMVRALHLESKEIVEVDESQIDGTTYVRVADPTPAPVAPVAAPVQARDVNPQPSRDAIVADERKRVADIESAGKDFNIPADVVRQSIDAGHSTNEFIGVIRMERAKNGEPLAPPPTSLDLSKKERENYSILNAVRVSLANRQGRNVERSLELEASDEIASRLDRAPQGFFVPYDVFSRDAYTGELVRRDVEIGGTASGAALVGTDHMAGGFIGLLRNRAVVGRLGATIIPGLSGNVDFPRQTTDPSIGWVGETGASGESSIVFDAVNMSPKTIRSRVDITRRMLQQGSPGVEGLVRNSLATSLALGIDIAAVNGSGASNQPEGVLQMSGVGSATWVDTSGETRNASVIELETLVAVANADPGSLAYLTTPEVRGHLKGSYVADGSGRPVFGGSMAAGELNGYRAEVTNALPKTLSPGTAHPVIAGFWPSLLIGEWGILDLFPDNTTNGDEAGLVLRAFQDVDIKADHEAAFATSSFVPPSI